MLFILAKKKYNIDVLLHNHSTKLDYMSSLINSTTRQMSSYSFVLPTLANSLLDTSLKKYLSK